MGNGVMRGVFPLPMWQELEARMLFNKINNSQPFFILDLRANEEEFLSRRVRGSHHAPTTERVLEVTKTFLFGENDPNCERKVTGVRSFVFLLPHSLSEREIQTTLSAFTAFIHQHGGKFVEKEFVREFSSPTTFALPSSESYEATKQATASGSSIEERLTAPTASSTKEGIPQTLMQENGQQSVEIEAESKQEGEKEKNPLTETNVLCVSDTATCQSLDNNAETETEPHNDNNNNDHSQDSSSFKINAFYMRDLSSFIDHYAGCDTLFDTGPAPTTQRRHTTTTTKYYATEILPQFLYLGDYANATQVDQLRALRITHVVDATFERLSEDVARTLSLQYLPVDVWDCETADIAAFFPITLEFIGNAWKERERLLALAANCSTEKDKEKEKEKESEIEMETEKEKQKEKEQEKEKESESEISRPLPRVLVHCRAGWSRSPTLVLAFLMQHRNVNLLYAARQVVRERPMVCPNPFFMDQLIAFERQRFERFLAQCDSSSLCDDDAHKNPSHISHLCDNRQTLRKVISEESCLWTLELTKETDFDRIPINAFKNQSALLQTMQESEELLPPPEPATSKPKKPFLKRGEGKKVIPRAPLRKGPTARYTPLSAESDASVEPTVRATDQSTSHAAAVNDSAGNVLDVNLD